MLRRRVRHLSAKIRRFTPQFAVFAGSQEPQEPTQPGTTGMEKDDAPT